MPQTILNQSTSNLTSGSVSDSLSNSRLISSATALSIGALGVSTLLTTVASAPVSAPLAFLSGASILYAGQKLDKAFN